ncbi:hypothetical protein QA633_08605 [Bradyrhizobium barranii]|nr:hypothetical protein [Bradyrhizobium barranii]WFT99653.1 hypothetical protein QA633_08605 [Bradyrhizobium barranii]
MSALYYREVNGGAGQHIDVSLLDAAMTSLSHDLQSYS